MAATRSEITGQFYPIVAAMANKAKISSAEELRKIVGHHKTLRAAYDRVTLTVSAGTCGQARGSLDVIASLENVIQEKELQEKVRVKVTGCHGFCEAEPNIIIQPQDLFYQHVKTKDAEAIIQETVLKDQAIESLLYKEPVNGKTAHKESEIPFYTKQNRLVLGDNALIDPTDIREYFSIGGYLSKLRLGQVKIVDLGKPRKAAGERKPAPKPGS